MLAEADRIEAQADEQAGRQTGKWMRCGKGVSSRVCVHTQVLYCARKAGVTHILKAGGAQVGHGFAASTHTHAHTHTQTHTRADKWL